MGARAGCHVVLPQKFEKTLGQILRPRCFAVPDAYSMRAGLSMTMANELPGSRLPPPVSFRSAPDCGRDKLRWDFPAEAG